MTIYNSFNPDPYHTHMKVLGMVKPGANVLEVGSSSGYITRKLLEIGCRVTAVEKDIKSANLAHKSGLPVIRGDIEVVLKSLAQSRKKFDCIVMADVLEHLVNPSEILEKLGKLLSDNGQIIISVPNIANISIRLDILKGNFNYREYGIMDKTHLHFYTLETLRNFFKDLQLKEREFDIVSGFECIDLYRKTIGRLVFRIDLLRQIEYQVARMFPGLFALEFIFKLEKR